MKQTYVLVHDTARQRAIEAIKAAPEGYQVVVSDPRRNLMQNARMWACLGEIAEQVDWYGQKLTADEWKDVFSAALRKQKVVPGTEQGTFVVIGQRTSQMTKSEMMDLIALAEAFGAERGVKFGGGDG